MEEADEVEPYPGDYWEWMRMRVQRERDWEEFYRLLSL